MSTAARRVLLDDPVGLGTALAVACVVRLLFLADDSLWFDEAFSTWISAQGPAAIVRDAVALDTHPPLYYVLLLLLDRRLR